MSQVLIGTIGVILFIGLALAGALYLGDNFSGAQRDSRTAAILLAVNQIAQAAAQSNNENAGGKVQGGQTVAASGLVANGYLKNVPMNPVSGGGAPTFVINLGVSTGGADAQFVVMSLGAQNSAYCDTIAKKTGMGNSAPDITDPMVPQKVVGCAVDRTNPGSPDYLAFARVG